MNSDLQSFTEHLIFTASLSCFNIWCCRPALVINPWSQTRHKWLNTSLWNFLMCVSNLPRVFWSMWHLGQIVVPSKSASGISFSPSHLPSVLFHTVGSAGFRFAPFSSCDSVPSPLSPPLFFPPLPVPVLPVPVLPVPVPPVPNDKCVGAIFRNSLNIFPFV